MMKRIVSTFLITTASFGFFACDSDTTDDTILEPSRESRIATLADAACDRYADTGAGCPGYGTNDGQKYADETACENDFKQKAEDLWPVSRCSDDRIDSNAFDACVNRAQNFACSTGGQNVLDAISALDECKADKVCTDAP